MQDSTWYSLLAVIFVQGLGVLAACHAILYKRDPRSAIGWAALALLSPVIGPFLYYWLGINRIFSRARKIYRPLVVDAKNSEVQSLDDKNSFHPILELNSKINSFPLRSGNRITPLLNGEQAYPQMLEAIRKAQKTITLSSYIFDNDSVGREFASALREAGQRNVEVKVIIDAIGSRYTIPTIRRHLKGPGLKTKLFLNTWVPWRFHYSQLRLHRKSLVVDAQQAFTGGMNIRQGHLVDSASKGLGIQDIHFHIEGPLVRDIQKVFIRDWEFVSKEKLPVETWLSEISPLPLADRARVIVDGPDDDMDKMGWTLLGAIGSAQKSIAIVTPYFVPNRSILTALCVASLRGVKVEIVLPERNNLWLVEWASRANFIGLLEKGCKIFLSPPPFDHSKLMIVDDIWCFFGSANWDARSLRLNFELNIECCDKSLADQLRRIFNTKIASSRSVTIQEMRNQALWRRLRDHTARLFDPYL